MKTNKYNVLLLALGMMVSQLGYAQFYVAVKGGFGTPFVTDDMGTPIELFGQSDFYLGADGSILNKAIFGTSGGGVQTSVVGGYYFNDNLGINLSATYARSVSDILDARINTPTYQGEQTSRNIGVTVTPSLMFSTGNSKKWSASLSAGVIVPVAGHITSKIKIHDEAGVLIGRLLNAPSAPGIILDLNSTVKTSFRPTFGYTSTLGLQYRFNPNWSIGADLKIVMLSIVPKESVFEEYALTDNIDGVDFDLTESDKHVIYHSELTETDNVKFNTPKTNPYDTSVPNPDFDLTKATDALAFKQSFNEVIIGFSLYYTFNKNKE